MSAADSVELTLPGATVSVPAARRFVRQTLVGWGLDLLVDAASLIVSELATNAVLHARSEFTVRLLVDGEGSLRVEVVDGSARQPSRRPQSSGATTGRGLAIVQALASEWGVEGRQGGKAVWVRLDSDAAAWGAGEAFEDGGSQRGRGRDGATSDPSGTSARAA